MELSLVVAAYYPVVLCAEATATYIKENSSATRTKSFDADWGFFERVNKYLMALSTEISLLQLGQTQVAFSVSAENSWPHIVHFN